MDRKEVDRMAQQLATGFEALRDQYEKLYSQHELLEKKLVNAREQVFPPFRHLLFQKPNQDIMKTKSALDLKSYAAVKAF
jgi:hypothetical protein